MLGCWATEGGGGKRERDRQTCFHDLRDFPAPFTIPTEKTPLLSLALSHTLTGTAMCTKPQSHHKDKMHHNKSCEYPLCYKKGGND